MTPAEITGRARKVIAEHFRCPPEKVTDDADFIGTLGGDSLDSVEIVIALEGEFDIQIEDADAENILTFGDAVAYLVKRLGVEVGA